MDITGEAGLALPEPSDPARVVEEELDGAAPGAYRLTVERLDGNAGAAADGSTSASTGTGTSTNAGAGATNRMPLARVRLAAGDGAGRRAAQATLAQLHVACPVDAPADDPVRRRGCPSLVIEDAPAAARRGLMLDISRDRVPTMAEFGRTVDLLAALRLDHLQLYTEHTLAYPECASVWGGSSPVTPEELRGLAGVCLMRGIELAANQNCFGHLHRWLIDPMWADLAETHERFDFGGVERQGPFSLCPIHPGSLDFVRDRLDVLLACVPSPLVHIGGDETFDIGTGASAAAVAKDGRSAVCRAFVAQIGDVVAEHGRRAMYWADSVIDDPSAMADMPASMIEMAWGYEPNADFDRWGRDLAAADRTFWLCPGTSSWRSFAGRPAERRANVRRAAQAARAHGASGVLITEWGDGGHRQAWPVFAAGLAEAAELAWNPEAPDAGRDAAISLHVFGDLTGRIAGWLRALGDVDRPIRDPDGGPALHNAGALYEDLHPSGLPTSLPADPGPWEAVQAEVDALVAARPPAGGGFGDANNVDDDAPDIDIECGLTAETMAFAAQHAVWRRKPGRGRDHAERRIDLLARLDAIEAVHESTWLPRSRPGGLVDSLGWWRELRGRLLEPPVLGKPAKEATSAT